MAAPTPARRLLGSTALLVILTTASIDAQVVDLVTNGSFDVDIDGWTLPPRELSTGWVADDALDRTDSGALESGGVFETATTTTVAQQCIDDIAPGLRYQFGGFVYETSGGPLDAVIIELVWNGGDDCGGDSLFSVRLDGAPGPDWFSLDSSSVAPASARSASLQLRLRTPTSGELVGRWDEVYFGLEASDSCIANSTTLCIDDRFAVAMAWETSQGGGGSGLGTPVSLGSLAIGRGGLFWLFEPDNPEVLVKVLDGCVVNDHFWVFLSAATDVGVRIEITDLATGTVWSQENEDRSAFPPVRDIVAFPCSPDPR